MKRLSLILMMIFLLSLTASATSAGTPPTLVYLASPGQPCQLPDATGQPQQTIESKAEMTEVAEHSVQASCVGILPEGSVQPSSPLKLSYSETKLFCATQYGDELLLTKSYGATVLPDGTAEINCTFRSM
ncbi:MAG: hypothetical protein HZY76_10405 [Anaerolineae bacterium]|nr:MAG: hypothetical protein HZY76_10405 [Anaerolineae bacterium]